VQPGRGTESILTDLADDGFIVENRPARGGFDDFSQALVEEWLILAFFPILETYTQFFRFFYDFIVIVFGKYHHERHQIQVLTM